MLQNYFSARQSSLQTVQCHWDPQVVMKCSMQEQSPGKIKSSAWIQAAFVLNTSLSIYYMDLLFPIHSKDRSIVQIFLQCQPNVGLYCNFYLPKVWLFIYGRYYMFHLLYPTSHNLSYIKAIKSKLKLIKTKEKFEANKDFE